MCISFFQHSVNTGYLDTVFSTGGHSLERGKPQPHGTYFLMGGRGTANKHITN